MPNPECEERRANAAPRQPNPERETRGPYSNRLTYVRHVERGEPAAGVPEHGVHGRRRLRAAPRRAAHLPHAVHHPAHLQRVPGLALHRRRPPVCRGGGAPQHQTPPGPAPPPRSCRGRQLWNEAARGGGGGHFPARTRASERRENTRTRGLSVLVEP